MTRVLTIKRVPTVVSNYQEDNNNEDNNSERALGCTRNCLGKCCLPDMYFSKLPLYTFKIDREHPIEDGNVNVNSSEELPQVFFLHNLLLGQWEDRMRRGLFRYDVTNCETKVIPGKYGFIAQLNEGRHLKKRLTEFWVDQVLQPFDDSKFNFTKVGQEEVLFRFEPSNDNKSHFFPSADIASDLNYPSVIAINVSPIEYGHVLMIPRLVDYLPQRIDHKSFLFAVHMAREAADPLFRVGYNSLGAFATINHLHYQVGRRGLCDKGVVVSELWNYPTRGLVFEGGNTIRNLSDVVASFCIFLQNKNIPFNVLISDCGKGIFLFPQCFAEKQAHGEVSQELLDTQANPAVWEINGHIVLKRRKDFDDASEAYAWRLLAEVSLAEARFQEVKDYAFEAAGLQKANVEENNINEKESLYKPPARPAAPHLPRDCSVHQ
ncbi:hypothetical protein RGQ29_006864 [Quercus rubra]|uniref:GDP-D-glucose phosphorylase 1 n=1 Tax=Quercus rubra TaxID=3512 RepID=A0AAN7E9B1_QUERU|nr:hypothetical protein RGQ29_006864 [Quercus rubra]